MRHLFLFLSAAFLSLSLRSQDFNYTATTDSVAWNELASQTILNASNSAWSFSYRIPIGFTFNYLGRNFDSLTIETNGYLVFDAERYYAFTAFNQFGDHIDSSGNHAVIGYELSGTSGNQVLKIQYKDAAEFMEDTRSQSWQIWLSENGTVEVHVGPGNYREAMMPHAYADSTVTTDSILGTQTTYFESVQMVYKIDSSQYCRFGLLNQNMDTENRGLLLGGNAASPTSTPIDANTPGSVLIVTIPPQGYRYVFIPAHN